MEILSRNSEVIRMLRLAFARGGLWFFGTVIVVWAVGGPSELHIVKGTDYNFWEELAITVVFGLVIGGCMGFYTWYNTLEEERQRQLADPDEIK